MLSTASRDRSQRVRKRVLCPSVHSHRTQCNKMITAAALAQLQPTNLILSPAGEGQESRCWEPVTELCSSPTASASFVSSRGRQCCPGSLRTHHNLPVHDSWSGHRSPSRRCFGALVQSIFQTSTTTTVAKNQVLCYFNITHTETGLSE